MAQLRGSIAKINSPWKIHLYEAQGLKRLPSADDIVQNHYHSNHQEDVN